MASFTSVDNIIIKAQADLLAIIVNRLNRIIVCRKADLRNYVIKITTGNVIINSYIQRKDNYHKVVTYVPNLNRFLTEMNLPTVSLTHELTKHE